MDIPQIKAQLPITTVLAHYHIEIDRNKRAKCPFHPDKTPSLQVYPETGTWCCFSSNCSAGTGDQIQFIQLKEGCSKHEAINIAKEMIGITEAVKPRKKEKATGKRTAKDIRLLTKLWSTFSGGLKQCKPALDYIESRGIQISPRMGYNGGRFHRVMEQAELVQCEEIGLIKKYTKKGDKQLYQAWAKDCIIFPLKDDQDKVVSFYGRSILQKKSSSHFYLNGRTGLYPAHPSADTKRLILTESIIDAESLLQCEAINSSYEILAMYGTNGLTQEHTEAIRKLQQLQEIILFLDGDQAGIKAAEKYSKELRQDITISRVDTPEGEDINSLIQACPERSRRGHSPEILHELIEQRIELHTPTQDLSFSLEESVEKESITTNEHTEHVNKRLAASALDTTDPDQLHYTNNWLTASVWGGIEMKNLSRLRVSIYIQHRKDPRRTYRDDLNLYSHASRERSIRQISERLEIDSDIIATTLDELTEGLERYRMDHRRQRTAEKQDDKYEMNPQEVRAAQALLKDKDLVKRTSELIGQSGLIGEGRNGLLLFFLYLSRLMDEPLHAIIYGKSGSGKTYLQSRISDCLPPEDVRSVTALTENTLYYSAPDYWKHKLLLIEDLDGIYEALLPLRELMSKQSISKLSTDKDSQGNNVQKLLTVEGPVCVSGATTKSNVYEDNANRSFMLHIDESAGHMSQVMDHQRRQEAGLVDGSKQEEARQLLQNAQRLLRPIKVVNPYALKLEIPDCVFKKLRTNMHYLRLIAMITFYNQAQRKRHKTKNGTEYIKTELIDIEWANHLVKESLIRKSDELSGELRSFFESLKPKTGEEGKFLSKELRKTLRMHPMKLSRYLIRLESRGYIRRVGGDRYKGYEYRITDWEDYNELLDKVDILDRKLEELRAEENEKNDTQSTSEKAEALPLTGVSHAFHTS